MVRTYVPEVALRPQRSAGGGWRLAVQRPALRDIFTHQVLRRLPWIAVRLQIDALQWRYTPWIVP